MQISFAEKYKYSCLCYVRVIDDFYHCDFDKSKNSIFQSKVINILREKVNLFGTVSRLNR